MRKTIASMLAAALVMGAFALPAAANKKKKIEDSFTVQLLPFPKLAAWGDPAGLTQPGCLAGERGVHWEAVDFEAPAKGTLTATLEGFTGDWDLYLVDVAEDFSPLVRSENNQIDGGAPALERVSLDLKKKQTVGIAPCNWLGEPEGEVTYEFVFAPKKKKKGKK